MPIKLMIVQFENTLLILSDILDRLLSAYPIAVLVSTLAFGIVFGYMISRGFRNRLRRKKAACAKQRDDLLYNAILAKPPYKVTSAMFKTEISLYWSLYKIARNNNLLLFVKIRLADFMQLADGLEYADSDFSARASRELTRKHVDFLLVRKKTYLPVCAIECDGPTHQTNPDTMRNDAFKDIVLPAAGIPIVRFPANRNLLSNETFVFNNIHTYCPNIHS